MNADPILKRIWRVQGKLARKAGYDARTYAQNAEKTLQTIERRYGLTFKYADISELTVRPLKVAEEGTEYIAKPTPPRRKPSDS
jgi:hypothetical protein